MTNFLIKISLSILLISGTVPAASAQSRQAQDTVGAIGNLFGALAKAGAKSKAQKGWDQISEPIKACLNTTLESKKITVEQLVAAGIAPSNDQVAPLVTSCNQIMTAQLQTNIPCNVTNSKGQQVVSTCNQVFAKDENGQIFEISRDDFLRAAGNGEKVQIAVLELSSANSARLAEERRLAEAEKSRLAAAAQVSLKKESSSSPAVTMRLNTPKGVWKFLAKNETWMTLLRGSVYIGDIKRSGDSIGFGVVVIPKAEKQVIVPWYNNGRDGFSFETTAHVLWGWAKCKENEIYFNKVDYLKGAKPNYVYIKSVVANEYGLRFSSHFFQAQDAFKIEKITDESNIFSNEIRSYCS